MFSCADILTFFSCMKQLFLFEETVAYFPAQESMGRWLIFLWDQACVLLMPSVMCYWFYLHHLLSFCGLVIQCDFSLLPAPILSILQALATFLDLVLSFCLAFPSFCLAFGTSCSLLMLLCHCLPDGFSFCLPAASLIFQSCLHLRGGIKTLLLLLNQVVFVLGNERV